MFTRKKEQSPLTASTERIQGRYVRVNQSQRGGYVEYGQTYHPHVSSSNLRSSPRAISEVDISESYLTPQEREEITKKKHKGSKLKIPFLQKKKKNQSALVSADKRTTTHSRQVGYNEDDEDDDDDDETEDITTYDEGIPVAFEGLKISNVSPATLGQYKKTDDTSNQYEVEAQIQERLNYIVGNYRQPPPYPGNTNIENGGKSMMQQLLQEKSNLKMRDTASMINYCQVDAPKGLSMEDLTKIMQSFPEEASQESPQSTGFAEANDINYTSKQSKLETSGSPQAGSTMITKDDKLVMRTQNKPSFSTTQNGIKPGNLTPAELNKRRYLYYQKMYESETGSGPFANVISEIYPRDYEPDYDDEQSASNNVNNSGNFVNETVANNLSPVVYSPGEAFAEHPEPDYDLPTNENGSYNFAGTQDYEINSAMAISGHYREKSETYVPPSPYMHAEIPEWLQVYSKASPDLDQFLKWEMFRIPELDCWQTMLKRLYMKELEQVVLWFEEYRQSLQQELERREREMGINRVTMAIIDPRIQKSNV
eukprot:gene20398-22411_t